MLSEGTHVALEGGGRGRRRHINMVHQSPLPFMGCGERKSSGFLDLHLKHKSLLDIGKDGFTEVDRNQLNTQRLELNQINDFCVCVCVHEASYGYEFCVTNQNCVFLHFLLSHVLHYSPKHYLCSIQCQKRSPDEPSKIVTTTFPAVVIMLPINSLSLEATEASLRNIFNFVLSSTSPSTPSPSSKSSS